MSWRSDPLPAPRMLGSCTRDRKFHRRRRRASLPRLQAVQRRRLICGRGSSVADARRRPSDLARHQAKPPAVERPLRASRGPPCRRTNSFQARSPLHPPTRSQCAAPPASRWRGPRGRIAPGIRRLCKTNPERPGSFRACRIDVDERRPRRREYGRRAMRRAIPPPRRQR